MELRSERSNCALRCAATRPAKDSAVKTVGGGARSAGTAGGSTLEQGMAATIWGGLQGGAQSDFRG
jgi:hypothetical protein